MFLLGGTGCLWCRCCPCVRLCLDCGEGLDLCQSLGSPQRALAFGIGYNAGDHWYTGYIWLISIPGAFA
eukprot:8244032-Prorocentrum_lima.AAC.1